MVFEAMQKMPFKQREVFALYELEGQSGKSISELLKIPENTVWARLHHARKKFQKFWSQQKLKERL
jgi:RNA polymerase sigma factor (sigma-70 family)